MFQEQQEEIMVDRDQDALQELQNFINSNPDPRELKRALAIRMLIEEVEPSKIAEILGVSEPFISKWKMRFALEGIEAIRLGYKGAKPLLRDQQRQAVIEWLKSKDYWLLQELEDYIETQYDVRFKSRKSYYELFAEAGISWKKSQKNNPKKDDKQVEARRREIQLLLEKHHEDIEAGRLVVYMVDECHLLWGDVCGYVWGKTNIRIEIPMTNERERQTFYGALNFNTQKFIIKDYEKGNTQNTIAFVQHLQSLNPKSKILIIWDGASYHQSKEFREFLAKVNEELPASEWKVTCEKFAPNDPDQNPVEDVWLQAKNFLRQYWRLCRSFEIAKWLFMFLTQGQTFNFSKLDRYRSFPLKTVSI